MRWPEPLTTLRRAELSITEKLQQITWTMVLLICIVAGVGFAMLYSAGNGNLEPWALRPQLVNVPLSGSTERATLEVDSTGRMWVAYDVSSTVEVRYSDGLYTSWSAPITVASGINSDDISAIIAMPDNSIGVLWSNQSADRFGFRIHRDIAAPGTWLAPEVPAGQSALSVGAGMADDHLNMAVASDGTLYAAVKTSYDSGGYPSIALLVRRPNGVWDNVYTVDNSGTRPVVVISERPAGPRVVLRDLSIAHIGMPFALADLAVTIRRLLDETGIGPHFT